MEQAANCANNRCADNSNERGPDPALKGLQLSGKPKNENQLNEGYLKIYSKESIGLYPCHKDSSFQGGIARMCVFLVPGSVLM